MTIVNFFDVDIMDGPIMRWKLSDWYNGRQEIRSVRELEMDLFLFIV